MLKWITDYIRYVENRPQDFNEHVKNNVRQIKELISRPNVYYKEADPLAFQEFARMFKHREGVWAGQPIELNREQKYIAACILGIKVWNKKEERFGGRIRLSFLSSLILSESIKSLPRGVRYSPKTRGRRNGRST